MSEVASDDAGVTGEVQIALTAEEADMVAKVLLQARRGNLGWVAYRPQLLSQARAKIMRAAGLKKCEPDPRVSVLLSKPEPDPQSTR